MNKDSMRNNVRMMRPAVKALIVHNGKLLVVHERVRRGKETITISDFPGGGVEFGESLIDALKREVMEEVCLDVEVGDVVGAWSFVIEDRVNIVCIGYQCSVVGDVVVDITKNPADEDIYDAKWYSVDEILSGDVELHSKDMLDAVRRLKL